MSGSEKKRGNRNTWNISSIKRVTRKFLEISRCARQRQRNVPKKVCCTCKVVFFANGTYFCCCFAFVFVLVVFTVSLALHDFIFWLSKLLILKRASLLALAKSVHYMTIDFTDLSQNGCPGENFQPITRTTLGLDALRSKIRKQRHYAWNYARKVALCSTMLVIFDALFHACRQKNTSISQKHNILLHQLQLQEINDK